MKNLCAFVLASLAVVLSSAYAASFHTFQAADIVLGQLSFTTKDSFYGFPDRFRRPHGVAMDPTTGKVFISDTLSHRILRFTSAAAAETGGSAEVVFGQDSFSGRFINKNGSADAKANTLAYPVGLCVDSQGRLWVADQFNNRVLGFSSASSLGNNPSADIVIGQPDFNTDSNNSSGTTKAKCNYPSGVFVDSDDTLWVADCFNNRVLRFANVSAKPNMNANADGVLGQPDFVTAQTASGDSGMSQPYALQADSSGRLWVADCANCRVLRFDNAASKADADGAAADGVLGQPDLTTTTEGVTAAKVGSLAGLYLDPTGRLWVSDIGNNRVLRFPNPQNNGSSADIVLGQPNFTSDLPSLGTKGLQSPQQVSGGPDGSLFVADDENNRVLRFSPFDLPPEPPTLTIFSKKKSSKKKIITTKARLTIKGSTTGAVTQVTVKVGRKAKVATGTTSWAFKAKLKPGKNKVIATAHGPAGDSPRAKIIIIRK